MSAFNRVPATIIGSLKVMCSDSLSFAATRCVRTSDDVSKTDKHNSSGITLLLVFIFQPPWNLNHPIPHRWRGPVFGSCETGLRFRYAIVIPPKPNRNVG